MARILGMIGLNANRPQNLENLLMCEHGFLSVSGHSQQQCETEDVSIVMDGVIFNREELPEARTDALCIARLYKQVGFIKALQHVNGDFAIALWDKQKHELWLGRDRAGVRPLYFAVNQAYVAFASLPGNLFSFPELQLRPRHEYVALVAACHYRSFDNSPDRSPFSGMRQLPASHWFHYKAQTNSFDEGAYWRLSLEKEWDSSESDLAREYRELLLDSVMRRYKVAVNPAFTLSGGMDSSSVLACAVNKQGQKQSAFSSVYKDPTFDESAEIQTMLSTTVSQWYPVSVEPQDPIKQIQKLITIHHEPVATATWLSHYLICEQVKKSGYDSLFGGLGGDELNAGEFEYFFCYFADLQQTGQFNLLEQEIKAWAHHHDHPLYKKNSEIAHQTLQRLFDPQQPGKINPDRMRIGRYLSSLNSEFFDLKKYTPLMLHPLQTCLNNRTWQDLFYETMPCCLRAQDRHGESAGVSHFNPFLDYRLQAFMFRVPGRMKIRNGVTKILLREAMKGILPDETRTRVKKTGWNAPAHLWFSGGNQEQVWDLLGSQRFRNRGIYNLKEVERLYREHLDIIDNNLPRENHMMFFWQLFNLEYWLQWCEGYGITL
jgi:asparagine synthase (glutamine-hydrolysing)